jgi:hypothetical protein
MSLADFDFSLNDAKIEISPPSKAHFFGGGPLDGQTREDKHEVPIWLLADEETLIPRVEEPSDPSPLMRRRLHAYRLSRYFKIGVQIIRGYKYSGVET